MSNTKFTEGPWKVISGVHEDSGEMYDAGETWVNVNGPDGVIADCLHGGCLSADEDEALANAKLIAAAPELLEALKELHHYCDHNKFLKGFIKADYLIQKAGLAIKKATE